MYSRQGFFVGDERSQTVEAMDGSQLFAADLHVSVDALVLFGVSLLFSSLVSMPQVGTGFVRVHSKFANSASWLPGLVIVVCHQQKVRIVLLPILTVP